MHEDGCPLCGKPVVGDTALLGHLEFGHDLEDPAAYLAQLRAPAQQKRSLGTGARRILRAAGTALVVLALAGGALVGYQRLVVEADADTAAADTTPTTAPAGSTDDAPAEEPTSTTAPASTTTAPPTTAPATTVATTQPTTTTTTTPAPVAPSDAEFRRPFLLDPAHEGCARRDGKDVHTLSFRFSGSLNITFEGRFHPDRTGDGPHTTTHVVPAGTTGYVDHVVVADPAGAEHEVPVSPPIYLTGC